MTLRHLHSVFLPVKLLSSTPPPLPFFMATQSEFVGYSYPEAVSCASGGWSLGLEKPESHSSKQFWQLLKTRISKYSKLNLALHQTLLCWAALTKRCSAHWGLSTHGLMLEMLLLHFFVALRVPDWKSAPMLFYLTNIHTHAFVRYTARNVQ